MRFSSSAIANLGVLALLATTLNAQGGGAAARAAADSADPIRQMVGRLDLEKYKATIKGLTQFGDRRQGTDRNVAAVNWIEAQLKSYGCTNTERVIYTLAAPAPRGGGAGNATPAAGTATPPATTPATAAGTATTTPPAAGNGRAGGAGNAGATAATGQGRGNVITTPIVPLSAPGGGTARGIRTRTGVNSNPDLQPDSALRERDRQPTSYGERQEVFCTKVGSTHPEEMYIVGGHMDGIGWGEAANDDGSGTALVMELARIFSNPDVKTDRSIRFVLWNNEESGLDGSKAYVAQRKELQGKENPVGSGKYPEPKWLGMIQHDMMMYDHGMPLPDGTMPKEQRPEADVNVEFQSNSVMAAQSASLAWLFRGANEKYATDYPAAVGNHMSNTDSDPFKDLVAAISLRENERGMHVQYGWDPNWHQPTDMYKTYSDKDFRLGLNAAQTTLAAVGQLTGATLIKK